VVAVRKLVAHWWNGSWGTMTRRDIHVWAEDGWYHVEWASQDGREGGDAWFAGPDNARAAVRRLIEYRPGEWRDIIGAHAESPMARSRRNPAADDNPQ
jgi:hypothetical protein